MVSVLHDVARTPQKLIKGVKARGNAWAWDRTAPNRRGDRKEGREKKGGRPEEQAASLESCRACEPVQLLHSGHPEEGSLNCLSASGGSLPARLAGAFCGKALPLSAEFFWAGFSSRLDLASSATTASRGTPGLDFYFLPRVLKTYPAYFILSRAIMIFQENIFHRGRVIVWLPAFGNRNLVFFGHRNGHAPSPPPA